MFPGDNFGGSLNRVLYHSLDNDDDNDSNKNSSLYMKIAPDDRMQRKENQSRELFLREIYLYDEVIILNFLNLIELNRKKNHIF